MPFLLLLLFLLQSFCISGFIHFQQLAWSISDLSEAVFHPFVVIFLSFLLIHTFSFLGCLCISITFLACLCVFLSLVKSITFCLCSFASCCGYYVTFGCFLQFYKHFEMSLQAQIQISGTHPSTNHRRHFVFVRGNSCRYIKLQPVGGSRGLACRGWFIVLVC